MPIGREEVLRRNRYVGLENKNFKEISTKNRRGSEDNYYDNPD